MAERTLEAVIPFSDEEAQHLILPNSYTFLGGRGGLIFHILSENRLDIPN